MNEQSILKVSNKRQSNIELLRIIAMILIVAHHFSVHGGFVFSASEVTLNKLWIQFIQIGGKIGVNIFVLISGYFLINVKSTKISKILKLWIQIFTYSVALYIIFLVAEIEQFGIKKTINHIFPITFSEWWFASTYFVLYLIFPYLNKLLISLDKKTYQKLIVLTTICWCLIPTIFNTSYQSNNLIWFMYLYSIAGYIKLHITNNKISSKKSIIIALILIAVIFLSAVVCDFIGIKIPYIRKYTTIFFGMQKLPLMLASLFLFVGFLKINIKSNKVINTIATATFGVYLIHDNNYVRKFLWKNVFKNTIFSNNVFLIPYSIGVIIFVFLTCTLIELFRIHILEKHYIKYIDNISKYINKCINKFFNLKIFET